MANIIGIDETIIEKQIAVEKIKSLATKKFISVNIKNVQQFKVEFFGKIILASNNEDRFMKVDDKEVRFWVRKLGTPRKENHNILNDMTHEIPHFLHYLRSRPPVDRSKSRMVLTAKEISNEYLTKVKEESKSGLYHELQELFIDFFNNYNFDEIDVTPIDIKRRWFAGNHQISINYIRKTLKNEYNLQQKGLIRYIPFGEGDNVPGRPYIVERKIFTQEKALNYEPPF